MSATDGASSSSTTRTPSTTTASNPTFSAALKHHRQIKAKLDRRVKSSKWMRMIVLALLSVYFILKNLHNYFLPYGPAIEILPTDHAKVNRSNDLLQFQHKKTQKIITTDGAPIHGPETIVFGNDGTMYALSEDAFLIQIDQFNERDDGIHINSTTTIIADLGPGRPLGGKFTPKGNTLYICDAILGLTRIRDVKDRKSKLEIVTRSVPLLNGTRSPILYADDVVIGPKTGKVYFTDATDIRPIYASSQWDTLFASKLDLLRGKAHGRLLQYDPTTDKTSLLASDLKFANGIGIDKDETYLIVAETFGVNVWKFHLNNGTMELLLASEHLPGYVDGVDCSWTTGLCYTVMPSAIVPMHHLLNSVPIQVSQMLRTLMLLLPKWLVPPVQKFGGLVEMNPMTKEFRLLQDPTGRDISMITGVTVHKNKLYLGSLSNQYIGVYNIYNQN
jgi:Strictosidine synthase